MAIRGRRYPAARLPRVFNFFPTRVITIGSTSETDTAQPFGRAKARTLGLNAETDTAQPFGRAKAKGIGGPVAEVDTAQPFARAKARTLVLVTETDTARAFGRAKAKTLSVASETDTAWPITPSTVKSVLLATAHETDTPHAITPVLTHTPYLLNWWFRHRGQTPPYWSERPKP